MLTVSRKEIEAFGDRVKCTDSDKEHQLEVFCYAHCDDNDDPLLCSCRGIIFNNDTVVMKSFPHTPEYVKWPEDVPMDSCVIREAYEGVLIRMFYFADKWWRSTTRKLDAYKSRWSSKTSFGQMFDQTLESVFGESKEDAKEHFESLLDKDKQYIFLITNDDTNRIVCKPPETPKLYHVATFVNGELNFDVRVEGIPEPQRHSFNTEDAVMDFVNSMSPDEMQGVFVFTPTRVFKILNIKYKFLFDVRGNESSVKFRYLQLRNDSELKNTLVELYPSYSELFMKYENILEDLVEDMYNIYVDRYIRKNRVNTCKDKHSIISECNKWHRETRLNVSRDKIREIMNSKTPVMLNRMIRATLLSN